MPLLVPPGGHQAGSLKKAAPPWPWTSALTSSLTSSLTWFSSLPTRGSRLLKKTRVVVRKRRYTWLHLTYFLLLDALGTCILWLSPKPSGAFSFIDSLYSSTSALTVTGLTCLRMHRFAFSDKVVLLFLMILGSQWFTSFLPLLVRRFIFRNYLSRAAKTAFADPVNLLPDSTPRRKYWTEGGLRAWIRSRGEGSFVSTPTRIFSLEEPANEGPEGQGPMENHGAAWESLAEASPTQTEGDGSKHEKNSAVDESDANVASHCGGPSLNARIPAVSDESDAGGNNLPENHAQFDANLAMHHPHDASLSSRNVDQKMDDSLDNSGVDSSLESKNAKGTVSGVILPETAKEQLPSFKGEYSSFAAERKTLPPSKLQIFWDKVRQVFPFIPFGRKSALAYPFPSLSRFESDVAEPPALDLDELSLESGDLDIVPILEYKSLTILSWIVLFYGLVVILIGFLLMRISLLWYPKGKDAISSSGLNSTFFCFFLSVSAFCNGGWTLLESNLIPFQENVLFLCTMCILILIGNTLLAPCLRGLLRLLHDHYPPAWRNRVALKYLLDEPRRCFTHLFPHNTTLWLVFTVFSLNAFELVCFLILDWKDKALENLSAFSKLLAGLSQSVCTRTAGFNVIDFTRLSPSMFILYAGLMYVAVYPVYLSRQKTRVKRTMVEYELSGLKRKKSRLRLLDSEIFSQGRAMVLRDSAFLFLIICLISILEDQQIRDDKSFGLFNVIFEVFSAYGNVGLSFGYRCASSGAPPDCQNVSPPLSFSGVWKDGAKFVLVLVMLAGRQRGLPDDVDSAIVVPKRKFFEARSPRRSTDVY